MDFVIDTDIDFDGFDDDLANSLWQTFIYSAPSDTGNLRSAIKKNTSNSKKIKFVYDESKAAYLIYLEEGVGPVKKHKDFISVKSVMEGTRELMYFLQTGKVTFSGLPTVVLKGRKSNKKATPYSGLEAIGYEKHFFMNNKLQVTARERSLMSKIYYRQTFGTNTFSGKSPLTVKSVTTANSRIVVK